MIGMRRMRYIAGLVICIAGGFSTSASGQTATATDEEAKCTSGGLGSTQCSVEWLGGSCGVTCNWPAFYACCNYVRGCWCQPVSS